ncbi:oxygen-independent coproporphyrinogen III oxidase [Sphingomonas faeni]|uniref:oxygen-independent coproporphyrinogen III oxidase n=1 Tax=Sphingomonas faeni TaxID=185950 RepID=UPI0020C7FD64|nr:oxygen-independent coproporphyrinogen III oxidase [Sphingomonas faeni]MCP8893038.1 oxygen-independent coproporphyrinogen III oxidase [Sphingomonas faeni]
MWTYYPDLLAKPVPRYTSYPTAAEFTETVASADLEAGLADLPAEEPLSLYVHIPYCREICWYCGCNTGAATREARLSAYVDRLHDEIDLFAAKLGPRGVVGRIAFGGGSPNAIAPEVFLRLVDRIKTAFRHDRPVISVELDPRGFDEKWAAALATAQVERASLGVQTFDPAIQARIGRVQPAELIERTVSLLRTASITSLNFDLMYGLPGQTGRELEASLAAALALAPDRLAVFGYAHVPQILPRQRRIDASQLPSARDRFDQAALAHRVLTGKGYQPVGFDHFATPADPLASAARNGTLRRNFQGFTDDRATCLLGLGASAISSFPDRLLQNEKNTGRWHLALGAGRFATHRGVLRTPEDRARGTIVEDILTHGAADLSPLTGRSCVRALLLDFEARGLLRWRGESIVLAEGGLPYARAIAARLDQYRGESIGRFSHAV